MEKKHTLLSIYPAKLLLFGEHTILQGSLALAVPLWKYAAQCVFCENNPFKNLFLDYLNFLKNLEKRRELRCKIDFDAFEIAIQQGFYLQSSIPQGYGLGSSGAVCAAIYDQFALQKIESDRVEELRQLQLILAQLEGYFHGSSSGIDPLICYTKKILVVDNQFIKSIEKNISLKNFFLLDTQQPRQGKTAINYVKEQSKKTEIYFKHLVDYNNQAIKAFLADDFTLFWAFLAEISAFQYNSLPALIPNHLKKIWEESVTSPYFKLKICGAGGGGFILGFSQNQIKTNELLINYCPIWL